MSYCRFIEGDVYAYACEGGVQFWVAGKNLDRLCNTYDSAYQYAKYLRDEHGLDVPDRAIDALREDAVDEARCICGEGSAVAETIDENARLRKLVRLMYGPYLTSVTLTEEQEAEVPRLMRELGIEVR